MRTLPWTKKGDLPTVITPKESSTSVGRFMKRPRAEAFPGSDEECDHPPKQIKTLNHSREPSTSPPPEPPIERFMEEGQEHDDKYRMVEDEFLMIAKSFTVHLHTAEYKRLGKIAKARNADTINSISRPVIGRMPNATKRRAEELIRSKGHRDVLENLVGKKEDGLSDDSDEEALPFVGTSLHGLMTNPKKRGISLMKVSSPTRTTRAAAGFRNPTKLKSAQRSNSPTTKRAAAPIGLDPESTDSEDDDDLDGPISAPKFPLSKPSVKKEIKDSRQRARVPVGSKAATSNTLSSSKNHASRIELLKPSKTPDTDSSSHSSATQDRIARRIAQAKLGEKQAEENEKKLDIIPTFL